MRKKSGAGMEEMMKERRIWLKVRRKNGLRILSAGLSLSMLLTGCGPLSITSFITIPDGVEQVGVALQEGSEGTGSKDAVITGFGSLPDEVREQTVPLGTMIEELNLPGALEAYVAGGDAENEEEGVKPPEDSEETPDEGDDKGDETPSGGDDNNGGGIPDDGDTNGGDIPGEGDNSDDGNDGGTGDDSNGGGNDNGSDDVQNGGEGTPDGDNGGENSSGSNEDISGGDTNGDETGDDSNDEKNEGENNRTAAGLHVRTGSFVMPEYQSDNVITVNELEVLEDKEESATIEGVTWESVPAYDGDTVGVYVFAPALPEGYVLADDISLPEITVTVVEDSAQAEELRALMELLRSLPDPEEYLSYDEDEDFITKNQDMIDEGQLSDARQAVDDYLEKYPDTEAVSDTGTDGREAGTAALVDLILRLEGLEHIRDTKKDCMDLDCPYHYPWFVQERMEQDEVPELLTLEDLIEDYGVEEPQAPAAQTYGGRARAAAYAATALHPQTLLVTKDNEDNAHTGMIDGDIDIMMGSSNLFGQVWAAHPIEISFTLDALPAQSAYLAIKAYDVDEESGEIDRVYLNDDIYTLTNSIGKLSGTDSTWNTTVLEIPIHRLQKGKNVISVTIPFGWVVTVDWMQLVLDGGAADSNLEEFSLEIKDTATNGGNVTVYSDVTVKQKGNTKYATEYTLTQESTGNALDACFGSAAAKETVGLTMPLTSSSGLYRITGILKNPSTEEIKAIDRTTFYFEKGVGVGPGVSHTLTPVTLTNQNVVIRVTAENTAAFGNVTVSPASRTVTANGTYSFTVNYQMGGSKRSYTYYVEVDNIDKKAPTITYTPITVEEERAYAEVKTLFDKALLATDDRRLAEQPFTYTLPTTVSNIPGTKTVTVTASDYVGNKATKACKIIVTAKPISLSMGELKAVTGSKDSYALKAVLDHTGADTITETGFVWGVMPTPTLDLKNGTVKTSTIIKTKGGTLSANATGLSFGVEYYARAYAKVRDAAGKESVVYSDVRKFGLGIPAYGIFSVSGVSGSTFTITRTGGTDKNQTVYYRTVNGSAIGGTHFTHKAGTVTFADGEKSKTVTVTEKSVTTAYGGKTATAYSNADRQYSLEIYRVDGGGTINQGGRSRTRTMTKNSSYTVDRTVYTTEKSKRNVNDTTGTNGKRIADTKGTQGGKRDNVRFLTNRYKETNYNTSSSFLTYYTDTRQNDYLKNTADGWYYRYDLKMYEQEDGYEHAYFGKKALSDVHYGLSSMDAAVSGVDGQLWACSFLQGARTGVRNYYFPDTRTGGGENSGYPKSSSGTAFSYNGKTYVGLGWNDTCYIYFGSSGKDSDIWYVDGLVSYAIVPDTVEPKVIAVAPMAGGTYLPGDPITVALVFDEIVDKTNSGDLGKVTISTNVGTLTYAGGADTNVLYFTGKVSSAASLSGSSALKVTGITNNGSIKDMCNLAGTTASFVNQNTNVTVDATKPTVTITAQTSGSLPRHQAKVTATGAVSVQYAWTKDANLPAYGWQTTASGAVLTESRGTAGTTETWYLHVLAAASSGASTHEYKAFTFMQPTVRGVSVRSGSTVSYSDVADVWKPSKYIVVQYAGTQTGGTTLTIDGPKTSSQSITDSSGSKYLYVTQNGSYTVTLKDSYGNVASQAIEVKKIDGIKPTVTLRSGNSTGTGATYNALSVAVLPEDTGGSGVAKVEYAWTDTTAVPTSWRALAAAADGSYQAAYTATETTKTAKYLHVRVTDGAGNISTVGRSGPYQVLRKATAAELPTITVTGNPTTWKKSATLTWTAKAGTGAGAGTIEGVYTPDCNTMKTGTTGTCTVTKNGIYMFTVTDSNGNSVTREVLVTKLDNEAPKVDDLEAAGGKTGTITLKGTTDNCTVILDAKGNYSSVGGSGIRTRQYRMTGDNSWKIFSGSSITVSKNGAYEVRLTDNMGNMSEYSVDMTDIDATAPKVTCTVNTTPNAKSGWYTVSPVPIILTFADEAGAEGGTPSGIQTVQYKLVTDNTTKPASGCSSLSAAVISSGTYTYNMTSHGKYYLYYKVTDKKGNVTEGFSDLIQKDSYSGGSGGISGPATGQPVSAGLAMNIRFIYGPAGGYLTGGTAASAQRIATMGQHAAGTKQINAAYTAKVSGTNYFRYYRYALNGETGTKYSYWSFYVRRITFDSQGGSAIESQLVWDRNNATVYCTAVKPTDPTRTGYTFGGWYTDAACTDGNEFDFTAQIRANTTLYAKWTANTYNVAYHLTNPDGSAYVPAEAVTKYTYGQGLTLPAPAQEGYTFYGWYGNSSYTGTTYTSVAKTATGDKEYYGYLKDTQKPDISIVGYQNTDGSGAADSWLRASGVSAPLIVAKAEDNAGVTGLFISVDGAAYSSTGISSQTGSSYSYELLEGEHTYTFKAVDAAGNEAVSETRNVRLDKTKPEIGEIVCEKKVDGFLDWIIGQESLIVHIPVTDNVSGVKSLTYTETAITAAGEETEEKTVSLNGRTGQQSVDLKLDADWKGKISNITCADVAGNASDSKSVGGTSGGVIVEDNPPAITVLEADMTNVSDPQPGNAVSEDYYEADAAPTLYVSVQDENADSDGISAGIKSITYRVGGGEEQTVQGEFAAQLSGSCHFIIPLSGYAGVVNVTVKAVDYAGNTAATGINVKIKGQETAPNAKPAYLRDTLVNLTPGSTYEIQVSDGEGNTETYIYTVGEQGEIPFLLPVTDGGTIDLCGKEIVLVKKGDGSNTTDSGEQSLTIVARPSAPQGTVTPELAADMDDAVINITVDGGGQHEGKKEYSTDGQTTWMDVPDDDIIKDLAPGDVCIRMKATEDAPRGETGTITVTPSSNKIKVEFALNYAGASAPSAQEGLTCKKYLDKPQDPERDGYDFTGWYKSAACEENGRWRFEESEAGAPNVVGDIIDKTQENYKDKYTVEAGVITVTLYAGWRENVKPQLNAVLMKDDEEKDENDWHRELFIAVTYSDNVGVAKLYAKMDDGAYTELEISGAVQNGTDIEGNTQYRFPYDSLLEGEHSYTFKAVDEAGNETETEVTAKLDKTKPVLGKTDFNEGYRNLWDWMIRKDRLIVTIPVTETGSGIADVEYILTPDGQSAGGDTGKAEVKKSSDDNAGYTATFGIAPDYKGKVIITAIDKAGNRSDEKTIGADGSGMNGVIIEDNAPVITILADRDITDEAGTQPNGTVLSEAYYNTAPILLVKVQDNETNGSEVITAGLSAISWKIGDGRDNPVNADFLSAMKTSHSFTINELEGKTGSLTVAVSAVDQAGNEAYKTVTVHIKEREAVPRPGIDYIQEKLTGLEPNAPYGIGADVITADAQGRIEIKEEWFDSEIQICRKGGESTLDSESAGVSIAARPAAPSVTKKNDETIKGKKDGAVSGVDAAMEYSTDSGRTWTAVKDSDITQDGAADFASGEIWIRVKATETAPHGYAETVEIGAGRTLTVTFVSNGGSSVSAITGKSWNDTVTSPQPPTREGYAFEGWYREEGCTTIWHFAPEQEGSDIDRLVDDVTLYAKWKDSAKPSISAALTDNKDGENWYQTLSFALTYSDNEDGTKLYVKRDNGEYIELETGGSTESGQDADGNTRYQFIYENLQEGEHTYTFKAVDMAGNEAETDALTARLDTTKPALGEASFNEGYTNIWHWIIRKDSLIITIPVEEAGSGIDTVEYTLTPEDGSIGNGTDGMDSPAGHASVKTTSGGGSGYLATISISPDFKGKVRIMARDKAGNHSDTKSIGTDGGGIAGVLIENNAPVITILADRFATDDTATQAGGTQISEDYYNTVPELLIKVADDVSADGNVIASGLKAVSWRIDGEEEQAVTENFDTVMKSDYSFKIADLAGKSGQHTVTVTAVDQAGNTAVETVTVGIKGRETKPDPEIDYENEKLTGLKPETDYVIDGRYIATDDKGQIQIEEYWLESTIHIYQPGDIVRTMDSEEVEITIPGRMAKPDVKIDYRQEKLTGLEAGKEYVIDGEIETSDASGCLSIEESQMNGAEHMIARERTEGRFRGLPQILEIPTRPAQPEGITAVNVSAHGTSDGRLLGLDDTMEYKEENGSQWIQITETGEEPGPDTGADDSEGEQVDDEEDANGQTVKGLSVGGYLIRQQATDYSFAGEILRIKLGKNKEKPHKPAGELGDGQDIPTDGEPKEESGGQPGVPQIPPKKSEESSVEDATAETEETEMQDTAVKPEKDTSDSTPLPEDAGKTPPIRGEVVVTVNNLDKTLCKAEVTDVNAVANAVLSRQEMERVSKGESVEIRIDVEQVDEIVSQRDKQLAEEGVKKFQNELPDLTIGMYIDISLFMRIGEGEWNAVNKTNGPIEIMIDIPEQLQARSSEFYIVRVHEGEYALLRDLDDAVGTITIQTELFSTYAIAYRQAGADNGAKCGLCHICPTFLGICCFIWLAVIVAVVVIVIILVLRRKKEEEPEEKR